MPCPIHEYVDKNCWACKLLKNKELPELPNKHKPLVSNIIKGVAVGLALKTLLRKK